MCQRGRPHHLGAGIVVARVGVQHFGVVYDGAQQAFGQRIGQFHRAAVDKITLHRVHHDVGTAGLGLVVRQGHGQFGVHDGKLRAGQVVVVGALFLGVGVGDDAAVAHLRTSGGDGQHGCNREAGFGLALARVQLPDIMLRLSQAVSDGLAGVDDRTAADSQQEVYAVGLGQLNALAHLGQMRVRHNAAQFHVEDARLIQRLLDAVQHAGTHSALAAVVDQHAGAAKLLHQLADSFDRTFTERDFGRGVIGKSKHCKNLLLTLDAAKTVHLAQNSDAYIRFF